MNQQISEVQRLDLELTEREQELREKYVCLPCGLLIRANWLKRRLQQCVLDVQMTF